MMAAGTMPSPFDCADIVSTTTHKTLRGPRAAMIFYQKNRQPRHYSGGETKVEDLINAAVFPGHQGGPHNHTIGALAVALKLAATPEFKEYQQQVLDNCQVLAACLQKHGVKLVSGGTDTHLVLLDLTDKKVDGAQVERVLEMINVAANKNTIPGDKSALKPSGLRIGTPAMTTRGFDSADFEWTADLISDTIELTAQIQSQVQSKNMASFKAAVTEDAFPTLSKLKQKVIDYVIRFPFYS
jgi:glycine hydroxymethyltransferase